MGKKLIICEKPSLAASVCRGIELLGEKGTKKDCHVTEFASYVVVPAFGHLFQLYDIDDYDGLDKWAYPFEKLPMVRDAGDYKYKLKADGPGSKKGGIKKQFSTIKSLIHNRNIDAVVNCGDADREGEIIVRIILDSAGNKKPVYRLWLPDQVESTIASALKHLEADSNYDDLAREGYARLIMDWLYGMNLSRYTSKYTGFGKYRVYKVGRVKGAIVTEICRRDREIRNFKPEIYYAVQSEEETNGEKILLTVRKKFGKNELETARNLAEELNGNKAVVESVNSAVKTVNAPKLFSQSALQNYVSKRYGMAPDTTLSVVQSLYEKGLVSYPRTPTEYLATAEKDKVKDIIANINKKYGNVLTFKDKKSIFDDSKIESHSAITPTVKIANDADFKNELEEKVYSAIRNRFMAVFCEEPCLVDETIMVIKCGNETFKLKGNVIKQLGWKKYENYRGNDKDKVLPKLKAGDEVNVLFKAVQKETQPPKHYTVTTLNNWMKNPFKKSENTGAEEETDDENAAEAGSEGNSSTEGGAETGTNDDSDDYRAILAGLQIGTEATRAGILKELKEMKLIEVKKATYLITDAGEYYVDTLAKLNIDMSKERTAQSGKRLKDVARGEASLQEIIREAKEELKKIFEQDAPKLDDGSYKPAESEVAGVCPVCGKKVLKKSKSWQCESNKFAKDPNGKFYLAEGCGFSIPGVFFEKKLTDRIVKDLLKDGYTKQINGFVSKRTGKEFSAYLKLEDGKVQLDFGDK